MSSEDGEPARKRRVQRACDACRRKKIRCEESQGADNRCLHCTTNNLVCSSSEAPRSRAPPIGYTKYLEDRLDKMEAWMQKHHPDVEPSRQFGPRYNRYSWPRDGSVPLQSGMAPAPLLHATPTTPLDLQTSSSMGAHASRLGDTLEGELQSSDDDAVTGMRGLEEHLRTLRLNPMHARYIGKSSGASLIEFALAAKNELSGTPSGAPTRDALFRDVAAVPTRRPEFWRIYEWETTQCVMTENRFVQGSAAPPNSTGVPAAGSLSVLAVAQAPTTFMFPPDDLIPTLIDAYFTCLNTASPVLHRPSFERALEEGVHRRDMGFGAVLLLVCALGARFVDDERALYDKGKSHSAGWQWFNQVYMMQRSLLALPCIYDVQICCLSALFLQSSCALWQTTWSIVGVGIRLALDVGAHRNKVYSETPTVHDELWRRAFWVLVVFDRHISSACGRPCAVQDEDFDVDLPANCDDEFWENVDPMRAFKQPVDKPSKIAFFISLIKLQQILAFSLRTIHSINKSKILLGFVGPQWEQRIVSELDSAMNQWIDSIPEHLRWDPNREDLTFFDQSATLYTAYYQLQITIHKPFIKARRNPVTSFPSLAICTNAARACAKVVHTHISRLGRTSTEQIKAAFTSGVVLLLSIWDGRRTGTMVDPTRELADVYKCIDVLKAGEERFQFAGRMWDILAHLASMSDLPIRKIAPGNAQKRRRERTMEDSAESHVPRAPPSATQQYPNVATMPVPDPAAEPSAVDAFRQHPPTAAWTGPSTSRAFPHMSASEFASFNSALHEGLAHLPDHTAFPGGLSRDETFGNATLHGSAAPPYALGDTAEQLTAWWALADRADVAQMVGGVHPIPPTDPAVVDFDAFGAALDALLSPPRANGPNGNMFDHSAPWTQAPADFVSEDWSQYLGDGPSQSSPTPLR